MTDREIAALARSALEEEVELTPKPGLVDLENHGANPDMDAELFLRSARALEPFFVRLAHTGSSLADLPADETLPFLRSIGFDAEKAMLEETGGVNTHRGALFSMGLLCASAGRLSALSGTITAESLCALTAQTVSGICSRELRNDETHGQQMHAKFGAKGVRGEVESGFFSARTYGLPIFRAAEERGKNRDEAALLTLLSLISNVADTNVLYRAGQDGLRWLQSRARALLWNFSPAGCRKLNEECIERNISPGGCADLLSVTLFLLNF